MDNKVFSTSNVRAPVTEPAKDTGFFVSGKGFRNQLLFPGISEVKPSQADFVFIRENASLQEISWFACRVRERVKQDFDRRRFFVKCDRCGRRTETIGALIGSPCGRCTTNEFVEVGLGIKEKQIIEGHLIEMSTEEGEKFKRDRERWQKEIAAKEIAAKKIKDTVQFANEGAGNMYKMSIPDYPEESAPKDKGEKR